MNKGYMTFAADMALMRHEKFVKMVESLSEMIQLPILIVNEPVKKESRIVNRNGNIVAEYEP